MKKFIVILISIAFVAACTRPGENIESGATDSDEPKKTAADGSPAYDEKRGEGKFTKVEVGPNLDGALAVNGEKVYGVKCSSCHKLTDERLVGPGWKGVTSRHTAEWIMNFSTNTDEMLNKDPKAQAQLEICLVRMPNQNIADDEARALYEFMRKNDGVK